jgi:hypothetical protein
VLIDPAPLKDVNPLDQLPAVVLPEPPLDEADDPEKSIYELT